jgi:predicted N-acetyltransferase YhbS
VSAVPENLRYEPILVRQASELEVASLRSIIQQAFEEYCGKLDPPSGAHREDEAKLRKKMAHGGALIAEMQSQPVACVLYEVEMDYVYLGRLAVLPAFRRRGIAQMLVNAVEERALSLNQPRVLLAVRIQLPHNRAFFERLGYRLVSTGKHEGYQEDTFAVLVKDLVQRPAETGTRA